MKDITKLVDELANLTMVELLEFKKILKEKYGIEESAPIIATTAVVEEPVKPEEKTSFNVKLMSVSEVSAEKLNAVKIVNSITNLGLKEAMAFTKNLPGILKENVSKTEGEEIISQLAALNAVVELV